MKDEQINKTEREASAFKFIVFTKLVQRAFKAFQQVRSQCNYEIMDTDTGIRLETAGAKLLSDPVQPLQNEQKWLVLVKPQLHLWFCLNSNFLFFFPNKQTSLIKQNQ